MTRDAVFLGIDLGTTNSSVAYVADDPRYRAGSVVHVQPVQLPFDEHEATRSSRMPSVVSRHLDDRRVRRPLIGWEFFRAFWQRKRDARALRRRQDFFPSVKSDMGTNRVYLDAVLPELNTPAKVSARIISALLDAAHQELRVDVRRAQTLITVPASFSALAREETLQAARLAGLDPDRVGLIDEPVAALLDLLNDAKAATVFTAEPRTVLVFDYGGGTCDLALVKVRFDGKAKTGLHVENLAISEYRRLGGDDIDREIMDKVVWPQTGEKDKLDADTRRRFEDTLTVTVARKLKEILCRKLVERLRHAKDGWNSVGRDSGPVDVALERRLKLEPMGVSTPLRYVISTEEFEHVMAPFLAIPDGDAESMASRFPKSLLVPVFQILDKAGLEPRDFDVLVLHGGGCRNPYVERMLSEAFSRMGDLFGTVQVVPTPDLDASVAKGAALACYWRHARGEELVRPIMAEDLGIVARDDMSVCLVRAGTPLPYPDDDGVAQVEHELYVAREKQPELLVPVYVGQGTRLAGSVRIPLPDSVAPGAAVRIKLAVDRNKRLRWWFSIQGGPYSEAPSVNDPWMNELASPELQRLLAHRRAMREEVEAGRRPSVDTEYREGWLLYDTEHYQDALDTVEDFLGRHADSARASNLRGLILGVLGRHEAAAAAYSRAAELDPSEPVYRGNYGCALFRSRRPEEAIPAIREALSQNPELTYLYEWLGDIYRHVGDEAAALNEYRRGLMLAVGETHRHSDWQTGWARRARLHRKLGEYDQADEAGRRADKMLRDARYGGDSDNLMTVL